MIFKNCVREFNFIFQTETMQIENMWVNENMIDFNLLTTNVTII